MRNKGMRKKIAGVLAAICFTVIIPTAYSMIASPLDPTKGYSVIALAFVLGMIALWIALWPDTKGTFPKIIQSRRLLGWHNDWAPIRRVVPVMDATRIIYEATKDSGIGGIFRAMDDSAANVLGSYAYALKDISGVEFFGMASPSERLEWIPSSKLAQLWFTDDLSNLKTLGGSGSVKYTNIAIRRVDIRRAINEIKSWSGRDIGWVGSLIPPAVVLGLLFLGNLIQYAPQSVISAVQQFHISKLWVVDVSHQLAVANVNMHPHPISKDFTELTVTLRNVGAIPIQYKVDIFYITIGDVQVPVKVPIRGGVLASHLDRVISSGAIDISNNPRKNHFVALDLAIQFGAASDQYTRAIGARYACYIVPALTKPTDCLYIKEEDYAP